MCYCYLFIVFQSIDISSTNNSAVKKANRIINSGHIDSTDKVSGAVSDSKDQRSDVSERRGSSAKVVKVLLLGAAESGKSTLVRQIRLIHGQSFNHEEILRYKHNIRSSCLEFFALLVSEYLPIQQTTSEWLSLIHI